MLLTITLNGCKKDEQKSPANNSEAQKSLKITKQLLDFRDNLKLKSGGSLPADSATWYLEGLLNYENANNDHNFINLNFIYDSIVIYTGGSSISTNDLNIAYGYFNNRLQQEVSVHNDTAYKFDLVDIQSINTGLKNGETVITMSASGGVHLVGVYIAFGADDFWRWGQGLGKCDGSNLGTDATDKLEQRFNNPAVVINREGFFLNVEKNTAYFFDPQYHDPDYILGWDSQMLFSAGGIGINPPTEPCLSPQDLNYYLSKFDFIKESKCPPTKSFKNVHVKEDFFPTTGSWSRGHDYEMYFGNFFLSGPNQN